MWPARPDFFTMFPLETFEFETLLRWWFIPGPALKGGDNEEGEHCLGHVIVVERVPLPDPLLDDGIIEIAVLVDDELAVALLLSHLGGVRTPEELSLEELQL